MKRNVKVEFKGVPNQQDAIDAIQPELVNKELPFSGNQFKILGLNTTESDNVTVEIEGENDMAEETVLEVTYDETEKSYNVDFK